MKNERNNKKGFTLIELSIAAAFISMLFIVIGVVTIGMISSYRKGLSMKSINTTGQDLIREFSAAIQESPSLNYSELCARYFNPSDSDKRDSYNKCIENKAYRLIYQQWYSNASINGNSVTSTPVFGFFCTGKYSYAWNTGYTFAGSSSDYNFQSGSAPFVAGDFDGSGKQFRLVKFTDPDSIVCGSTLGSDYNVDMNEAENNTFDITTLNLTGTELLPYTENSLSLYNFVVYPPSQGTQSKRIFYSASMIIATITGGINIMTSGDYCKTPAEVETRSDYDFCAINKFNFAMRATGV